MSSTIKSGTRLYCAVDATEFVVVKAPTNPVDLTIGGAPMILSVDARVEGGAVVDGHDGGAAIGKRYVNAAGTVELLCTKAGLGVPAIEGELLALKDAKSLPSSD